jgi:hypothetical protein
MGWWGYDIMEGDAPLDCEGDIINFLADPELVNSPDHDTDKWSEAMDAVSNSGFDALKTEANVINAFNALTSNELCGYDPVIAMQVLGEMIMCSGGVFPVAVRCACIAAATEELNGGDRGWKHEGEREKALNRYINRVQAYVDGESVEPSSRGLFDTIYEAIGQREE